MVSKPDKFTALLLFSLKLVFEFFFLDRICVVSPFPEGSLLVDLHPVDDGLPHHADLLVVVFGGIEPAVESSSDLHMGHPGDEVSHNLVAQRVHLGNGVHPLILVFFKGSTDSLDLLLLVSLTFLQLHDVLIIHRVDRAGKGLLPDLESVTLGISLDTVVGPVQELLGEFVLLDVLDPA